MAYKILYIEDLDPSSILHELRAYGFEVEHCNPESLDTLLIRIKDFDLLLLDFRLTEIPKISFDAPTIAQTLRTFGSASHLDIPVILISTEDKICEYYEDYTSKDLFDFSVSKETLLKNLPKYSLRFKSVIDAYQFVITSEKDISKALGISSDLLQNIDYRIIEKLSNNIYGKDVFAFNNFILNNIIRSIGVLIGEEVLSARLGVSRNSEDWEGLKSEFSAFKYLGIYSKAYDRWWSFELDNWWKSKSNGGSLRRLNAQQRVDKLKEITSYKNILPEEKTPHASSSNFWTICKDCRRAIDSIDGLELHQKDLFPWQEKEYISINAALQSSTLNKYIKTFDKERLREIAKTL